MCFLCEKKRREKEGMNAESFPDCRGVLDDVLAPVQHHHRRLVGLHPHTVIISFHLLAFSVCECVHKL